MNTTVHEFVKICHFGGTHFTFTQFPSNKYIINQTTYCIVNGFFAILTISLNSISVLTISRNSQLKAKLCYFLILIQSTVDMAVGLISYPLFILARASELFGLGNCIIFWISDELSYLMVALSFITLCSISFERYMSILHPIAHRSYLSRKIILIWISCSAVFIIMTGPVFRFISENIQTLILSATTAMLLILSTFAYTRIYLAVKNMKFPGSRVVSDIGAEQSSFDLEKKKQSLREGNFAKSCALVVAISYLCYIPTVFSHNYFHDDPVNYRVAFSWSMSFSALNSSINSVIFFWKRPLLRREALKILRKISSS